MRRSVLCLAMIASIAACENTTDPLDGIIVGGGGALTQAQAAGSWSFTLQQTTTLPCTTSPLANGTTISTHLDVLADGTLGTSTSSWVNPTTGAIQSLSGQIQLSNGITGITFAASGTGAMELQGTMSAAGTFTGRLTDPAAGFSQVFGTGGCEYTASGIKTG